MNSPFGVLAVAATAASVGVAVIETGGVVQNPNGFAALVLWTMVATAAAGLYLESWRPGNPLGRLLVVDAFLVAPYAFQGTANPVLFSIGLLIEVPATLVLLYVLLAYPSGRLERAGRIAFGGLTAFFALAFVPRFLFTTPVFGASPLARCTTGCPDNPLLLVESQTAIDVMHYLVPISRLVALAGVAAALVLRFAHARVPGRRMLLPVTALSLVWIVQLALFGMIQTFTGLGSEATDNLGFGVVMARAMLPAAFLLAPLQARAFSGLALQRMLARFEHAPTLLARERVIARTLDDPRLRVAFWLPRSRGYVDATGVSAALPDPATGLEWTPITRAGKPFAGLIHDAALGDDPELVHAAGRALQLAITGARIEADLERSISDLQRSRLLLLEADVADRRRLERDLHATAQQQLVALRVSLELARERAETNTALAERLAGLGEELDTAVEELRRIAADIYSPVLEEAGLTAALKDVARRSRGSIELDLEEVGRLPPEVESCVYFCVVEAVNNAFLHGGDVTPRVRLARDGGEVAFSIDDDGAGFEPGAVLQGRGLQGIVQRTAAVGGTARVVSAPGRGTIVSGHVPAGPRQPVEEFA